MLNGVFFFLSLGLHRQSTTSSIWYRMDRNPRKYSFINFLCCLLLIYLLELLVKRIHESCGVLSWLWVKWKRSPVADFCSLSEFSNVVVINFSPSPFRYFSGPSSLLEGFCSVLIVFRLMVKFSGHSMYVSTKVRTFWGITCPTSPLNTLYVQWSGFDLRWGL